MSPVLEQGIGEILLCLFGFVCQSSVYNWLVHAHTQCTLEAMQRERRRNDFREQGRDADANLERCL